MLDYLHHVPGRLRVRIAAIKRNECEAERLQTHLKGVDGVTGVEVNILTGSVTVRYDRSRISSDKVMAELAQHGICRPANDERATARATAGTNSIVDNLGKALFGVVIEKAVERSALALIAAIL